MTGYIDTVKTALAPVTTSFAVKNARRVYVSVPPEKVVDAARIMFKDLGARFAVATGVDTPSAVEILYHFSPDAQNLLVSLRVLVPKPELTIDSITPVVLGAAWIETEIHEMLGVTFRNHPGPARLLLSDDWPAGLHPLRRDNEDTKSAAAIRERLRRDGLLTAQD